MKSSLFAATAALSLSMFIAPSVQAEARMTAKACTDTAFEAVSTHGADTIAVGDLHLFNRRALETPPNARNAGGFLSIYNYASEPNRLVSASSPIAERVELHTMTMDNDVMRMRELEDGIALPPETQVDLEPGGLHVMFINLSQPFTEGDEVPVTLVFESGESQEIILPVRARSMDMIHGDAGDDSGHPDHGHHGGHN